MTNHCPVVFRVGTFAIIFDEQGRVLLSHRRDLDLWNLPGGQVESGESPWDGVVRETKEETGLTVEVVRLTGVYHKPEQDNHLVFSFICKVVGGALELTAEASHHEYFALQDIPKNSSSKQIERIYDAVNFPNQTICKTQLGPSTPELVRQGKIKKTLQ